MKTSVFLPFRMKVACAFVLIFSLFFVRGQVQAVGLGFTDDAPIMGITCGVPGSGDNRQVCCTQPGETRPVTDPVTGQTSNQDKAFVRGQLHLYGDPVATTRKPPDGGFTSKIKSIGSATGKILKLGAMTNPVTILTAVATGNFGDVVNNLIKASFEAAEPLVSSIAQKQADQVSEEFTNKAQRQDARTASYDSRCMPTGDPDTRTEPGKCLCKPLTMDSLDPNKPAAYVDWNKWVLAKVDPDKRLAAAQVLGASTIAQGAPKGMTDKERADRVWVCTEGNISDDFERRACIRRAVAVSPRFLDSCNKIKDTKEQEQCRQCILGIGNEYSTTYGDTVDGVWTGAGCLPADIGKFINLTLLPWSIGIGGGIATFMLMYASYLYMTSRGNPDKLKKAKDYINSSLIGLLVIIFSVFLLQLLGVTILRVPGLGQ